VALNDHSGPEGMTPLPQPSFGSKPPTFGAQFPENPEEGDVHYMPADAVPGEATPPPPPQNGGLKIGSALPPAIPPFGYDADTAYMLLGMEYAHRSFFAKTIMERAQESNDMHDGLLAVVQRSQRLENELAEARQDRAKFEQDVAEWQGMATEINRNLEGELAATREERDQLRDELGTLKLRKRTKG
jgi:hypothetical protein